MPINQTESCLDGSVLFPSVVMPSRPVTYASRSRSLTAIACLQNELETSQEDSKLEEGEERQHSHGALGRCNSLPHLKWNGPAMEVQRPGDYGDNNSITSAGKIEDRVQELESDLIAARDAILSLDDTVTELNLRIVELTSQLDDERRRGRAQALVEDSECKTVKRNDYVKYSQIVHEQPRNITTSVKEIGLQVVIDDDISIGIKGDHVLTSPDSSAALSSSVRRQVHRLQQQCREKDYQVQKLTEKLSKYYHRNTEMEAEQMSTLENLEECKSRLSCSDQQVAHMREIIRHQQEDIALLETIKEDLGSKCGDLEEREEELEDIVASLSQDMTGLAQEKRKLNRHIKQLNTSMDSKQIQITEKLGELEAKSNLLDVIKQIAFSSPLSSERNETKSLKLVTTTPKNSPAIPSPTGPQPNNKIRTTGHTHNLARQSYASSATEDICPKRKSSPKMPSKQQRLASRSLKYDERTRKVDKFSGRDSNEDYLGDRGYCGDNDDDVPPANDFYNVRYTSLSEDIQELTSPRSSISGELPKKTVQHHVADSKGLSSPVSEGSLLEEQFQQDFTGNQSSPKNGEQSVDDLIAEVLGELSEEDACEADMHGSLVGTDVGSETMMKSEGLLLRKHELENYAIRARDRSWQYVYVVQQNHQLWFYESKEHHQLGRTYDGEGPLELTNALVHTASDYSKRKHVFRIQMPNGQRFLFQARDDRAMFFWVCSLDSSTRNRARNSNGMGATDTFNGATPGIGAIPPPMIGSPSKTDRLRNRIKGGISALTK